MSIMRSFPLTILVATAMLSSSANAQEIITSAALGKPTLPAANLEIGMFAVDPNNQDTYFIYKQALLKLNFTTWTVPVTPLTATPWTYTVVAGTLGVVGDPVATEVAPLSATFRDGRAVAGWPFYAVGSSNHTMSRAARRWIGLWLSDSSNNVIRFVNFQRGNNVTLVAGSPAGASGNVNGVGTAVRCATTWGIAWGRFYVPTVLSGSSGVAVLQGVNPPTWTSVLIWGDWDNLVYRMGIPFHGATNTPFNGTANEPMQDVVLNVTTFAEIRGTGIVLVNPFLVPLNSSRPQNTTVVAFVTEDWHYRVSMVTPMFPATARYKTVIFQHALTSFDNLLTLARLVTSADLTTCYVEVFHGAWSSWFTNVSFTLSYNKGDGSIGLVSASSNPLVTGTDVGVSRGTALVHYTPNTSYNGTLVIFSGGGGLQFYCCLGNDYYPSVLAEQYRGGGTLTPSQSQTSLSLSPTSSMSLTTSLAPRRTATRSSLTPSYSYTLSLSPSPSSSSSYTASLSLSPSSSFSDDTMTHTRLKPGSKSVTAVPTNTPANIVPLPTIAAITCGTASASTMNHSVFVLASVGDCCEGTEVGSPAGLARPCSAALAACVTGFAASCPPRSVWVRNCTAPYLDCMVAAAFNVTAAAAGERLCPFAAQMRREVIDGFLAANYSATALRRSCVEAVRDVGRSVDAASGSCPVSTTNASSDAERLCGALSDASADLVRRALNLTEPPVDMGESVLVSFPALKMRSTMPGCDVCLSTSLAPTVDNYNRELNGMVVVEKEAAKRGAGAAVREAAAAGCGATCPRDRPYRTSIPGLVDPSVLSGQALDRCSGGPFNMTVCSETPSTGLSISSRARSARRQQGSAPTCQPHPETGTCDCPAGATAYVFPVAQYDGSSARLVAANLSLCLRGAEAFVVVVSGTEAEAGSLFDRVAPVGKTKMGESFDLLKAVPGTRCFAAENRTSDCTCRYNASQPSNLLQLTATRLAYYDAAKATFVSAVMYVCWGGATSKPAVPLSGSSTGITIAAGVLGGPAAAAMQAADLIGSVDCVHLQKQQVGERKAAAVPYRIGATELGGIYFLLCFIGGFGVLQGIPVLILSAKRIKDEQDASVTKRQIVATVCATLRFPCVTLRVWLLCFQGVLFEVARILAGVNISVIVLGPGDLFLAIVMVFWCAFVFGLLAVVGYHAGLVADEAPPVMALPAMEAAADVPVEAVATTSGTEGEDDPQVALETAVVVTDADVPMEAEEKMNPLEPPSPAENTDRAEQPDDNGSSKDSETSEEADDHPAVGTAASPPEAPSAVSSTTKAHEASPPEDPSREGSESGSETEENVVMTQAFVEYGDVAIAWIPGPVAAMIAPGYWPSSTNHYNGMFDMMYSGFKPRAAARGAGLLQVIQAVLVTSFVLPPANMTQCIAYFSTLSACLLALALVVLVTRPFRWLLDSVVTGVLLLLTGLMALSTAVPNPAKEGIMTCLTVVAVISICITVVQLVLELVMQKRQNQSKEKGDEKKLHGDTAGMMATAAQI